MILHELGQEFYTSNSISLIQISLTASFLKDYSQTCDLAFLGDVQTSPLKQQHL